MFKSIPEGQPPIARGRPDGKWKRYKVLDTIRRWYRFMTVDQSEHARIRQEWEDRFNSLPPDGDFNAMPNVHSNAGLDESAKTSPEADWNEL